jgi:hypothetical protein
MIPELLNVNLKLAPLPQEVGCRHDPTISVYDDASPNGTLASASHGLPSSLSDLNSKPLISLQFAFSGLKENCNDINMLAI